MILLFLGLAIVLTTSPLLLVASGKGRGDDGGEDELPKPQTTHSGEISGSVTITDKGEVWISALIDEISIIAQVEFLGNELNWTGYRLSIVDVEILAKPNNEKSCSKVRTDATESNVVEFTTHAEASNQIIQLLKTLGIPLSSESIRSIPHAIRFGWKSPEESKQIVNTLLEGNSGT